MARTKGAKDKRSRIGRSGAPAAQIRAAPLVDWGWFEEAMAQSHVESDAGRLALVESAMTMLAVQRDIRGRVERGEPVGTDEAKALPALGARILQTLKELGITAPKKPEESEL